MPWVSGYVQECHGSLYGPPPECEIIRACRSTSLTITEELWDQRDQVIIGTMVCDHCGAVHHYSRRPSKQELPLLREHHQVLIGTPRWQDVLTRGVDHVVEWP